MELQLPAVCLSTRCGVEPRHHIWLEAHPHPSPGDIVYHGTAAGGVNTAYSSL